MSWHRNHRPLHTIAVGEQSGAVMTNTLTSDLDVARLSLVRAVEEWFDHVVAPNWEMVQLDALPELKVRVR